MVCGVWTVALGCAGWQGEQSGKLKGICSCLEVNVANPGLDIQTSRGLKHKPHTPQVTQYMYRPATLSGVSSP